MRLILGYVGSVGSTTSGVIQLVPAGGENKRLTTWTCHFVSLRVAVNALMTEWSFMELPIREEIQGTEPDPRSNMQISK